VDQRIGEERVVESDTLDLRLEVKANEGTEEQPRQAGRPSLLFTVCTMLPSFRLLCNALRGQPFVCEGATVEHHKD